MDKVMIQHPPVPLTLEGSSVLHQMFQFRRSAWRALPQSQRNEILQEASQVLGSLEEGTPQQGHPNQSAMYSLLGHKGDLLFIHLRDSFEDLHRAELAVARLQLADYLELRHSYLSVIELGLYESTSKTYAQLAESGYEPHSPEWNAGTAEVIARQTAAMSSRLFPAIPDAKYICFYPMDRKRGEEKNWYEVSMAERQRMMHEHGMIGRRYADSVRQIITGSIGFDDWEWGVDLFSNDPMVFKKLIYEMRFDEVSAVYASFGTFYVGLRLRAAGLGGFLEGSQGI
jgi:hydrogen peroxide-dependent heme synthase